MFNSTSTTANNTASDNVAVIVGGIVTPPINENDFPILQRPAGVPDYGYAVANDIVMLPKRAFPTNFDNVDLRTAFTPAEIYVAEAKIREMKTVEDLIKQTVLKYWSDQESNLGPSVD